jgi:hypothetical protein
MRLKSNYLEAESSSILPFEQKEGIYIQNSPSLKKESIPLAQYNKRNHFSCNN